jgi:hypothetical protein
LLEGKLPDAVEQFLPADVADGARVSLPMSFLREVERLADKRVGVARKRASFARIESTASSKLISCILRFGLLGCRWWRMRGAIRFHRPAGQQQAQDDTENQLFLFRQAVHADNITETGQTATI